MSTAHKTDEEKKEFFDTPEELDKKISMLAEWIKKSKHFVAFTGAGISTSAGVPDFRSGVNTVLPTGPGAWEKLATKTTKQPLLKQATTSAIPTPTHMSLIKLQEAGYLKFLISQNTDGLHRKSGFPRKYLAELHGNSNLEVCRNKNCGKQYLRDFRVRTNKDVHRHETGTKCENCGEELFDTIINFNENLPEKELYAGFDHAAKADLCLALGSSLRVTPAADMPRDTAKKGGKLAIVNLQATPLDKYALRINGFIDDVMEKLMKKLELSIPPFILRRRVNIMKIKTELKNPDEIGKIGLLIRGVDETGTLYSLFTGVKVMLTKNKEKFSLKGQDPYIFYPKASIDEEIARVQLSFQGHYGEPSLTLEIPLDSMKLNEPNYFLMEFDPNLQKWVNYGPTTIDHNY